MTDAGPESSPSALAEVTDSGTQGASPGPVPSSPEVTPKRTAIKAAGKSAPRRAAVAKKTPAKKTARKAAKKGADANKTGSGSKSPRAEAMAAKYPRHTVEQALRIPRAIYQQNAGQPATAHEAAILAGRSGVTGELRTEISSAKKYGFLESGPGAQIVLTSRARRAIAPQSDQDRSSALREAVLAAPDISDVYNFYRGEFLPDSQFFKNALIDRFGIPADKIDDFIKIFMDSMDSAGLIDKGGDQTRLLDAGRDEAHQTKPGAPAPKAKVSAGTTCFVMQPFAGTLGTYFESIYKPAIEQAGLEPVRADDSIFGAGKIIDQIWRGISNANVLIAELTTKNPNVFYELGLAHALAKPVILVSSTDDDVPFDLRHLRYIKYDQSDPFWGPKLIDKIADNIKLAINDPEEAIFPLNN